MNEHNVNAQVCLVDAPIINYGDITDQFPEYSNMMRAIGYDKLSDQEPMVATIISDSTRNNWAHASPVDAPGKFPGRLPLRLFRNKKEEDSVKISYNNYQNGNVYYIRLICKQLEGPYKSLGLFENAMANLDAFEKAMHYLKGKK